MGKGRGLKSREDPDIRPEEEPGEEEEAGKVCGGRGSGGCKGQSGKGKEDEPSANHNLLGGSEISQK